jgi:ABC-type sugar transport system substrate-binding protein
MKSTTTHRLVSKRRLVALAAGALAGALALAGCGAGSDDASAGGKETFTIGVAQASTTIPFLATLDDAITKEAKRLGMKTVILNGNLDNAKQASNVETLISKRVDAIIVVSSSPTAVVGAIAKAENAGIPVFAVNAKLDKAAKIVTYVGQSDYEYGKAQGDLLMKALPDGGKIAVILGPLGDTAQVDRLAGLEDGIKSRPDIEIVANPVDEFDNAKNLAVTQDLLSKYPKGSLHAVVAQGPQMYVGANYAKKQGRTDIKFIAGDYPTQIEDAIRSGAVFGTVDQSPVVEGTKGAQYVHYWLTGQKDKVKIPEDIIDLPVVTKDNVDQDRATWGF